MRSEESGSGPGKRGGRATGDCGVLRVVAPLLLALQAGQAPKGQDAQARPTFRTRVEYVEVDATVNDNAGQFVSDLKKGDFEILEDGKTQTIDRIEVIDVPVEPRSLPVDDVYAVTAYGVLSRGLISGHWSKGEAKAGDFRSHSQGSRDPPRQSVSVAGRILHLRFKMIDDDPELAAVAGRHRRTACRWDVAHPYYQRRARE